MTEIINSLFSSFKKEFPEILQELFLREEFHLTNREALRCFLLGLLVNIFLSSAGINRLEEAYITTSPDTIFFFVVNKESQLNPGDKKNRMEMFFFDLSSEKRKPELAARTRDNLIAMLLADQYGSLLSITKFPKAKVIWVKEADNFYKVIHGLFLIFF